MSKTVQHVLPGFEGLLRERGQGGKRTYEPRWYYICDVVSQEMVVLDDNGHYTWIPHDTIRLTPHLFNSLHIAKQERCKLNRVTAVVERYIWQVK